MSIDRRKMKPVMMSVFEDIFSEIRVIRTDIKWLKKLYWFICALITSDWGLAIWRALHP